MKRVLITGGSGFLGRCIVECAKDGGYEVVAPRSAEFDLESGVGVRDLFERQKQAGTPVEAVIHSAAHYGGIGICAAEPLDLAVRNLRMAATIFYEAACAGVKKIVSIGSTCAYPSDMPNDDMREEDIFAGRCHESVEAYGYSKRVQLVLMAAVAKQYGVSCSQLSLTNLYGEGDVFHEYRAHAIAALIKKISEAAASGGRVTAWGSGAPVRQFLYVKDAARIVVCALRFPNDDLPVNVGGHVICIRDLAHIIADVVGLPHERFDWDASKPDGVSRKVVSEEKLRRLLSDYSPIDFVTGLENTVRWYLANKTEADRRR